MSFDLLDVPDEYQTSVVLVVAPYVDPKFMEKLIKQVRPERLCLLVDDGARLEDIEKIREVCESTNGNLEVRLGRAPGLVHIKAFYFEYIREGLRKQRRRRLIFGSANATNAGFSGRGNAELIADVNLAISDDSDLADYFESILGSFSALESTQIEAAEIALSKAPILHLPSFRCEVPGKAPSGFDTWLQRGVLAARYRNTPQFLAVNIQLRKPLPQDLIAKIFADRHFAERTSRNVVRYGYIDAADVPTDDEDDTMLQWKAKFAVWTHLGDWISDECYGVHHKIMKAAATDVRRRRVAELLEHSDDPIWKAERRDAFIASLQEVWEDLCLAGSTPSDYLASAESKLNISFYGDRFDQKLEADIELANEPEFRERYENGYEFPDTPRFRQDTSAWEKFVRSWCDSILVEACKTRSYSLVTARISEALATKENFLAEITSKELAATLRASWKKRYPSKKCTIGEWIMAYHDTP